MESGQGVAQRDALGRVKLNKEGKDNNRKRFHPGNRVNKDCGGVTDFSGLAGRGALVVCSSLFENDGLYIKSIGSNSESILRYRASH